MLYEPPLPYTVGSLTEYIQALLEGDDALMDVWVEGEISNFRKYDSGHCYFTLKDELAQVKGVIWRSSVAQMRGLPRDGEKVRVHGRVSLYPAKGEYQIVVDRFRPLGIGDLYGRYEALRAKLLAEGLFDAERKRPLPTHPRVIGIVTSADAAAFQDVQNVLRRRFPIVQVVLSACLVQGDSAPPLIVKALERLNAYADAGNGLDAILVCRGGGSIEDLWAFNDERVARAIVASRVPVISGVGHETDFTICDFAADVRAPTPSAAAEMLTPDIADLRADVQVLGQSLAGAMTDYVENRRETVRADQVALRRLSPQNRLDVLRQRLDDWNDRLAATQTARLRLLRERVSGRIGALNAASPTAILERGYALITRSDTGERITSAALAAPGDGVTIRLADGDLNARIEDEDTHARYPRTLF